MLPISTAIRAFRGFPPHATRFIRARSDRLANNRLKKPPSAFVIAATLLLSACTATTSTGLIYRINPPGAQLAGLEIDVDGRGMMQLRLANFSTVPMRFAEVSVVLSIDGAAAARIDTAPGIVIPALSNDVIALSVAFEPAAQIRIAERSSGGGTLSYALSGYVRTEEPNGRFPVDFQSRLNPVPGKPGAFR